MDCRGEVQSANAVIHLIVEEVVDLSAELKRGSGLDAPFAICRARRLGEDWRWRSG
jgi:hypothetical protein